MTAPPATTTPGPGAATAAAAAELAVDARYVAAGEGTEVTAAIARQTTTAGTKMAAIN